MKLDGHPPGTAWELLVVHSLEPVFSFTFIGWKKWFHLFLAIQKHFCSVGQVHGCSGELSFCLKREERVIFTNLESFFYRLHWGIAKVWKFPLCAKPKMDIVSFAMHIFKYWNWWVLHTEFRHAERIFVFCFMVGSYRMILGYCVWSTVGKSCAFTWLPSLPFRVCHLTITTTTTITHTQTPCDSETHFPGEHVT